MTKRMTVLVAESDAEQARRLSEAIAAYGWDIQARDAVSATAAVQRQRPDAVVLNQRLPGGGGTLALRRLRASVHTAMTPVIAIVGSRASDPEEMRLHGADECVGNPADVDAIAAWIKQCLARPSRWSRWSMTTGSS